MTMKQRLVLQYIIAHKGDCGFKNCIDCLISERCKNVDFNLNYVDAAKDELKKDKVKKLLKLWDKL